MEYNKYITNNELCISKDEWFLLNKSYTKDDLKLFLKRILLEVGLPYKKISEGAALRSFKDLCEYNPLVLAGVGESHTRYKYTYGLGNDYLRTSLVGIESSDYFHQENRFKCDSLNGSSLYTAWTNESIIDSFLNSLWRLKVEYINAYTIRTAFALSKYIASQFKPAIAKYIYTKFNSKNILDFSMGWGDRLAAFHACPNTESYIGVDPNYNLFDGYYAQNDLYNTCKFTEFINAPAEDISYDEYKFDTIFTSPPYYIMERYTHDDTQSWVRYKKLQDWLNLFLFDTLENVWGSLIPGGHLIINISDVYANHKVNRICDPMNDFIKTLPNSKYIGSIGMQMSHRMNTGKKDGVFVEPMWVWQKI